MNAEIVDRRREEHVHQRLPVLLRQWRAAHVYLVQMMCSIRIEMRAGLTGVRVHAHTYIWTQQVAVTCGQAEYLAHACIMWR